MKPVGKTTVQAPTTTGTSDVGGSRKPTPQEAKAAYDAMWNAALDAKVLERVPLKAENGPQRLGMGLSRGLMAVANAMSTLLGEPDAKWTLTRVEVRDQGKWLRM